MYNFIRKLVCEIVQDVSDDVRKTAATLKNHLLHAWHPYVEEVGEEGVESTLKKFSPFVSDDDAKFIEQMMHVEPEIFETESSLERERVISILDGLMAPANVSKSRPLGKYAFAMIRKDVPPEMNTAKEQDLEYAIMKHFVNNRNMTAKEIKTFKLLLKQGKYADVIREPDVDVVYRGVRMSHESLEKLVDEPLEEEGILRKAFTLSHYQKKSDSSWTIDYSVAQEFAEDGKNVTAAIFHARVKDNPNKFMACDGALYKLSGTHHFKQEHEVIALGPVRVYEIEWRKL